MEAPDYEVEDVPEHENETSVESATSDYDENIVTQTVHGLQHIHCKTSSSQRIFANLSGSKNLYSTARIRFGDFEPQPGPSTSTDDDEEYTADLVHRQPPLVTQLELNDLVRDLELPKSKSQLLGSPLQQCNLLGKGVKISSYRTRQSTLKLFFSEDEGLVFCPNSNELMIELKMPCDPHKWRLFIDSSKASLKVFLLANGNDLPSVPVAYSVDMKETYENISQILYKICYDYKWKLCAGLKVVAVLTGLQTGYTKFCCFLCEWDNRARYKHYIVRKWPRRETFTPGQKCRTGSSGPEGKYLLAAFAHQTRIDQTDCESNG
ncbi:hypothetical protein AVEN_98876-1 [Araneus ventricosus]|uniref:Uncharacterized protein n=1 Tax=Araneus ventricosus TaxID=182803 RepID=A0A4Y2FX62_ARAVE|nr:hypothetical protein AVEN_98876-1 [Araneus ventricosus]